MHKPLDEFRWVIANLNNLPVVAAERRPPNPALSASSTTEGARRSSPASRVLVTGASGFLGSAIAAALRARGHDVRDAGAPLEPADQSRSPRHAARGRPPRSRLACGGAEGRPIPLSRRRRLSAVGARSRTRSAATMSREPGSSWRRRWRAGVERIVYTSSVATLQLARWRARDRDRPLAEEDGDRRLQAQQGRRRAAGRGHGPPGRPAGRDRQPVDADRPARHQADADRPHHRRGGVAAHAGLRRHRPQPCPRRRRRRRPSRGARPRAGSASAISSAARTCSLPTCSPTSPDLSAAGRRRLQLPRTALYPVAYGAELVARFTGASRSSPSTACAWPATTCSSTTPRRGASSATHPGPTAKALADAIAWFRAHGYLPMIAAALALLPLAVWAYLLFGRGGFWLCGERDDTAASERAATPRAWPGIVAVVPARDEADVIAESVGSLLRPGLSRAVLSVVLVDDQSADGTADAACAAASAAGASRAAARRRRSRVAAGLDRQAVGDAPGPRRGRADAAAPEFVLLTDADIAYAPHVARRARRDRRASERRPHLADGQAALRELGRALADPGLRLLLPHALSLRLGERPERATSPRRPAAACWCGARRSARPAVSRRSAAR